MKDIYMINYSLELKNFLDKDGKLKCSPKKKKYKILSLAYLATKFKQGVEYNETDVNRIIDQFHLYGDRCLLRRELFNKRFMGRTNNCEKYWLEIEQPNIEELY
jgi:hypothetical protein